MKSTEARVVLVTCGTLREARRIARAVIEKRLAACVNIITAPAESVYRWKEKVETAREFLLLCKSADKQIPALQREVQRLHSYDVPEFIVLPIIAGSRAYLNWIVESVTPARKTKRKP